MTNQILFVKKPLLWKTKKIKIEIILDILLKNYCYLIFNIN